VTWRVPLADLVLDGEEREAVLRVLERGWLTMGEETQRFEEAFASMVGVKHAIAVTNATVGLHLAILALGVGRGEEVICPSLSFVATANAVKYVGATPIFADVVSLQDFSLCPEAIEGVISPRTRAILVMHYGGYPCDMPAIHEIASRHSLPVIEDAAHAPGALLQGRMAGAWGEVAVFSFFSNKNLATGEGGMLTTDRDDLAESLRLMRSHGMTTLTWDRHRGHAHSYDVVELGYNYRMDEVRSAMGRAQLNRLSENNQRRREIRDAMRERLSEVEGISLPYLDHPGTSAAHLFPILLDETVGRNNFMRAMKARGVQTSIHYPPIHQFTYYASAMKGDLPSLPITEAIGRREVTLPLFPTMTEEQMGWVVEALEGALSEAKLALTKT
jgi:dTDP-4-amino-4,6-dideoxygalactose transaminase